jgi:hypothetical protein
VFDLENISKQNFSFFSSSSISPIDRHDTLVKKNSNQHMATTFVNNNDQVSFLV